MQVNGIDPIKATDAIGSNDPTGAGSTAVSHTGSIELNAGAVGSEIRQTLGTLGAALQAGDFATANSAFLTLQSLTTGQTALRAQSAALSANLDLLAQALAAGDHDAAAAALDSIQNDLASAPPNAVATGTLPVLIEDVVTLGSNAPDQVSQAGTYGGIQIENIGAAIVANLAPAYAAAVATAVARDNIPSFRSRRMPALQVDDATGAQFAASSRQSTAYPVPVPMRRRRRFKVLPGEPEVEVEHWFF
ncbi:MAG TPA: hypothetical protein VGD59_04325 [Acidisarcina sp.]